MLYKETDQPTFSPFSFAIKVEREEMRKIIMIKVILVFFVVASSKISKKRQTVFALFIKYEKIIWRFQEKHLSLPTNYDVEHE